MDIILNELKFADKIIQDGPGSLRPAEAVRILAGYCLSLSWAETEIREYIETYLKHYYGSWPHLKLNQIVAAGIKSVRRYPLSELSSIPVYQQELNIISNLANIRTKRLAFTLLCLSRYADSLNENNNGWVNKEGSQIFKLAGIQTTIRNQNLMLKYLIDQNLIGTTKRIDNTNIQVLFSRPEGTPVLTLTDMNQLGYEYMLHMGQRLIKCSVCGTIFRPGSNRSKYCKNCASSVKSGRMPKTA